MREKDVVAVDTLAPKNMHLPVAAAESLRALIRRPDSTRVAHLLAITGDTLSEALGGAAFFLTLMDSAELAEGIIRRAAAHTGPRALRASRMLLNFELWRGRWNSAKTIGDALPRQDPWWSDGSPSAAILPFLPVPRPVLEEMRQQLEGSAWATVPTGRSVDRTRPHRRLYVLGVLDARLGEYERALREAEAIQALSAPPGLERPVASLAEKVRAAVAFERGDYPGTLAILDRVPATVPLSLLPSAAMSGERDRYLRAESLFRLGRLREAQRWFEHGFGDTESAFRYRGMCFLRLAEIHDRLGERDQAAHYFARALAVWDPDPPLQPVMAAARQRLAQLSGERLGHRARRP